MPFPIRRRSEQLGERPIAVTLIAGVFVAAGLFGFGYHVRKLAGGDAPSAGLIWVLALRLIAVAAGLLLLWGVAGARWIAIAWLAYHTVSSAVRSTGEFAVHALLLAAIAFALFRRAVSPPRNAPSRMHPPSTRWR